MVACARKRSRMAVAAGTSPRNVLPILGRAIRGDQRRVASCRPRRSEADLQPRSRRVPSCRNPRGLAGRRVSTTGRSRDERRSLRLGRNPPRGQTCCGRARVGRRESRRPRDVTASQRAQHSATRALVAELPAVAGGPGRLAWLHRFRRLARTSTKPFSRSAAPSSPGAT